eukprot:Rmarinus@m.2625
MKVYTRRFHHTLLRFHATIQNEQRRNSSVGFVGLPNVGKSTLFNAVTRSKRAAAENFPFCTIDPNKASVDVPDPRLTQLAAIAGSERTLPATVEVTDIAGLCKGAHKGEGLGNKFLANIREVHLIAHVVRCFEDGNVVHVEDKIDPIRDIETIATELVMSDFERAEKQYAKFSKGRVAKGVRYSASAAASACERALRSLNEGKPVSHVLPDLDEDQTKAVMDMCFLTTKPVLHVCNVDEKSLQSGNQHTEKVKMYLRDFRGDSQADDEVVIVSARFEAELSELPSDERVEFLEAYDLDPSLYALESVGAQAILSKAKQLLQLSTFYTVGPIECRAWRYRVGSGAAQAAGVIHSDFEKKFICAEVLRSEDVIACGGMDAAKAAGKMRIEGKDYPVQDGDVLLFKHRA